MPSCWLPVQAKAHVINNSSNIQLNLYLESSVHALETMYADSCNGVRCSCSSYEEQLFFCLNLCLQSLIHALQSVSVRSNGVANHAVKNSVFRLSL
jgi:hypothetical protein